MSLHAAIRNDVINAFITREPRRDDVPPIDRPRCRAHAGAVDKLSSETLPRPHRRGFSCVPSMNDSLEVEVLYPA
jgi:hypothetical protein